MDANKAASKMRLTVPREHAALLFTCFSLLLAGASWIACGSSDVATDTDAGASDAAALRDGPAASDGTISDVGTTSDGGTKSDGGAHDVCHSDADCPNGLKCNTTLSQCAQMPDTALCRPCTNDGECGGSLDNCLRFEKLDGGAAPDADRGCGRTCSNAEPCPVGFICKPDGTGRDQCHPYYAEPEPTCAGIRATIASDECWSAGPNDCAAEGFDDSSCWFGVAGALSWCTIKCLPDAGQPMCPPNFQCGESNNGSWYCLPN